MELWAKYGEEAGTGRKRWQYELRGEEVKEENEDMKSVGNETVLEIICALHRNQQIHLWPINNYNFSAKMLLDDVCVHCIDDDDNDEKKKWL